MTLREALADHRVVSVRELLQRYNISLDDEVFAVEVTIRRTPPAVELTFSVPHPLAANEVRVDRPKTARLPYSTLTHAVIDTGWQLLTRCGRRVTWLTGQDDDYDPGTGVVDCPTCREP